MIRLEPFRRFFVEVIGAKPTTFSTYQNFLKKIDVEIGGLDEKIAAQGVAAVGAWGESATSGPFAKYRSSSRSVLRAYLRFAGKDDGDVSPSGDEAEGLDEADDEISPTLFAVEREMQAAVRRQLHELEPGLREDDGGYEVSTLTGRVDILARDSSGGLVAIELKAGHCPSGAMEQVLGYAQALMEERGEPVRAILIAGSFSDRLLAACRQVPSLQLRRYEVSLTFPLA